MMKTLALFEEFDTKSQEIEKDVCKEVNKDAEEEFETARINAEKIIEDLLEKSNNRMNVKINFV